MLPLIFVLPLLQLIILSNAATFEIKNIKVGYVDFDRSSTADGLMDKFTASTYFQVKEKFPSQEIANSAMLYGDVDVIITIPSHFERDLLKEQKASLGLRINAIDEEGGSVIQLKDYSIQIVDFEPDKVLEFIGVDRSGEEVAYSWNGQKYVKWEGSVPSQLPRNAVEVDILTKIQKNDEPNEISFHYNIFNQTSSLQSIEAFAVRNTSKKPENVRKSKDWRFNPHLKYRLVSWQVETFLEQHPEALLEPGESDSSFSFTTTGLPRPATYYVKGNNGDLSFDTEDLISNSVTGITLGPYNPPENASVFTDSVRSYTIQACELGWITNKGICNSLQKKLDNVKRQLERGNTKTAGNVLGAFINQVQALKDKKLSSEGYGLLYYNAVYLLEKLEGERPENKK
jgi:ABC-2 type transport system permease protein